MPAPEDREPREAGFDQREAGFDQREAGFEQDATRYLCAAVTLDPALEHKVLYDVLEEPDRAIVSTLGVDLVTVLKTSGENAVNCANVSEKRHLGTHSA
jgi:hypothetical protein